MERRLIILRHAKSAWDTDAPTDHARPLNKRGRRDAPRIGDRLRTLGWTPEVVYSSDSARTRETWRRMRASLGADHLKVHFTRALYHAGIRAVREVLSTTDTAVATVMIIGHNPGWESVVEELTGRDERITTCNAALLTLGSDNVGADNVGADNVGADNVGADKVGADTWADAGNMDGCWTLHRILRPKEL